MLSAVPPRTKPVQMRGEAGFWNEKKLTRRRSAPGCISTLERVGTRKCVGLGLSAMGNGGLNGP